MNSSQVTLDIRVSSKSLGTLRTSKSLDLSMGGGVVGLQIESPPKGLVASIVGTVKALCVWVLVNHLNKVEAGL